MYVELAMVISPFHSLYAVHRFEVNMRHKNPHSLKAATVQMVYRHTEKAPKMRSHNFVDGG